MTTAALAGIAPGWDTAALVLADLFHLFAGHPYPSRPTPVTHRAAALHKRLLAQRARLAARSDPTT
jgi:hypothetical protein